MMSVDLPPPDVQPSRYEIVISEEPQVRLSVIEAGSEGAPPTIVFIHGFGGWKEQWLPQMRCFSQHSRVIALDLRGHGNSDKPRSTYSTDELLRDVEIAIEKLSVGKPFVLVGHSFGAALVAQYAAEHPEQVEKVALISPSSDYALNPLMSWVFWVPDPLFDGVLSLINAIRPTFLAPAYVLKALYRNALRVWNADEVLPRVQAPTAVISPRWDPLFPKNLVDRVAELIPNAERIVLSSSDHVLMTAVSDALNEAISGFLGIPCAAQ